MIEPLNTRAVATMSIAGLTASALEFRWLVRIRQIPRGAFIAAAGTALPLSWVPDLIVCATGVFPRTSAAGVLSLMSLHLVFAALALMLLVGYGLRRE